MGSFPKIHLFRYMEASLRTLFLSVVCVSASAGSEDAALGFYFLAQKHYTSKLGRFYFLQICKYASFHFLLLWCAYVRASVRSWKIQGLLSFYLCCSARKVTEYISSPKPPHQWNHKVMIHQQEGETRQLKDFTYRCIYDVFS